MKGTKFRMFGKGMELRSVNIVEKLLIHSLRHKFTNSLTHGQTEQHTNWQVITAPSKQTVN